MAYVADLFDLEARKSAFLTSEADRMYPASAASPHASGALAEVKKAGADRGMFYDVHGLIFDHVAPNMRSMIEAAIGLPMDNGVGGLSRTSGDGRGLKWLDVLDLGCGRGVMGSQLQPLANYMTGVDLSEEAIKHATRSGSYDEIKKGDAVIVTKVMRLCCVYDIACAKVVSGADRFPASLPCPGVHKSNNV